MPKRTIKSPWCCGARMTGNDEDGYVLRPQPGVKVVVRPVSGCTWKWEAHLEFTEDNFTHGKRSAANAATRWIRNFSKTLYDLSNKQP